MKSIALKYVTVRLMEVREVLCAYSAVQYSKVEYSTIQYSAVRTSLGLLNGCPMVLNTVSAKHASRMKQSLPSTNFNLS